MSQTFICHLLDKFGSTTISQSIGIKFGYRMNRKQIKISSALKGLLELAGYNPVRLHHRFERRSQAQGGLMMLDFERSVDQRIQDIVGHNHIHVSRRNGRILLTCESLHEGNNISWSYREKTARGCYLMIGRSLPYSFAATYIGGFAYAVANVPFFTDETVEDVDHTDAYSTVFKINTCFVDL